VARGLACLASGERPSPSWISNRQEKAGPKGPFLRFDLRASASPRFVESEK
jgi:hypothetical protein